MSATHWLVFTLEGHEYALPLEHVVEAIPILTIVPVAEAPAWLAGVINLRGRVMPVMDLRARLGLSPRQTDLSARILVTSAAERWLGLIVDSANEVLALPAAVVELPEAVPNTGLAVIHLGERLITVLELERLSSALDSVAALGTGAA